jgi:CDP-glucose 4,6-dehydratase
LKRLDGRRIFVTGHTGFKGAWTIVLLRHLGAHVTGYSLDPPTSPSLFEEAGLASYVDHHIGDVRDLDGLRAAMLRAAPDAVIHLAAQSLVLEGLADPIGTYATNVMGTAHVLEAMRGLDSVRATLIVTSDKCYRPGAHAMREDDPLGGHDPYSASKAAAEIVVEGYRPLFAPATPILMTARAGNVIGGGDWSANRLLADLARAMLAQGRVTLRHPGAIRPWQHVLDALNGYVALLWRALDGDTTMARAWNFGPARDDHATVADVVRLFADAYGAPLVLTVDEAAVAENPALMLDSTRAHADLGWRPVFDVAGAVRDAASFYRRRAAGERALDLLAERVDEYLKLAESNPA